MEYIHTLEMIVGNTQDDEVLSSMAICLNSYTKKFNQVTTAQDTKRDLPDDVYKNSESLGELLTKIKDYRGLTVKELASSLSVTTQAIYRWQNNESRPTNDSWKSLRNILGIEDRPEIEELYKKARKR